MTTSASTPAGSYTLTINGSDGPLSHSAQTTLVVQAPAPDFTLSASPGSQTVSRGGTTTYTVSVNPANTYNVSLSVSGLPFKATASFSPNPASSTSTLTVSTWRKSTSGSYTLTITGTSGGISRTTTVTLVIT